MLTRKPTDLARATAARDPFGMFRTMMSEFDRVFDAAAWPPFGQSTLAQAAAWMPGIDVLEKDGHLVTKIDLPGVTKQDVKVDEVKASFADGVLEVSVPLPARAEATSCTVAIQEPAKPAKTAA
jgi:HSP20 family molecular chaperone IbpA